MPNHNHGESARVRHDTTRGQIARDGGTLKRDSAIATFVPRFMSTSVRFVFVWTQAHMYPSPPPPPHTTQTRRPRTVVDDRDRAGFSTVPSPSPTLLTNSVSKSSSSRDAPLAAVAPHIVPCHAPCGVIPAHRASARGAHQCRPPRRRPNGAAFASLSPSWPGWAHSAPRPAASLRRH